MKLLKFSSLRKQTDINGVINVLVEKDTILKISFPELLIACSNSFDKLSDKNKQNIFKDIFANILQGINVPTNVIDNINELLNTNDETSVKETLPNIEDIQETPAWETDLVAFVSLLVNEESPEDHITFDELKAIVEDVEIETVVEILENNNFVLEKCHDGFNISINVSL